MEEDREAPRLSNHQSSGDRVPHNSCHPFRISELSVLFTVIGSAYLAFLYNFHEGDNAA